MSRIWKERLDPEKHRDFMSTAWIGGVAPKAPSDRLIEAWVFFVKTADCQLQFVSRDQVIEARDYFGRKTHPARRETITQGEPFWQRWYERLPAGVHREEKRQRLLAALDRLLDAIDSDALKERSS